MFDGLKDKFEAKVMPMVWSGCHEWMGTIATVDQVRGYQRPVFSIMRRNHYASRVAYELYKGPILDGLLVCHSCDNTTCVNPDHLFLGTSMDNYQDSLGKGRAGPRFSGRSDKCHKGHSLSGANLIVQMIKDRPDGSSREKHSCRTCKNESAKMAWRAKRAINVYQDGV